MTVKKNRWEADIKDVVRILSIRDGDVVLVRHGTKVATDVDIALLQSYLARTFRGKVIIGVVDSFDDLKVLNEQDMNRLGWFRVKAITKTVTSD